VGVGVHEHNICLRYSPQRHCSNLHQTCPASLLLFHTVNWNFRPSSLRA